jgi:RNA polymerase sigma-70 factor (ECF subfamily)
MSEPLGDSVQRSWHRFLDVYEPLRPDLYRYCRYLSRCPWDAEDLAQDTLARAFVTLGCAAEAPANPRAWLFRVASNLWINRAKRDREVPGDAPAADEAVTPEPRATREAAGTLLVRLSPQERAAVVLKDVFDLTLDEIAGTLGTSIGAIKAALHRGRGKLAAPEEEAAVAPVPAALDAFCDAFNARDLERLTALLLDTATVEFPGLIVEHGAAAARAGSFRGTLLGCEVNDRRLGLVGPPRCEVRVHRGEPLLLWWWGGEVRSIVRATVDGDRIATMHNYFHAPELLAEVCRELGVPFRTNGHHYW